jgi:hypothetical protein
MKKVKQLSEKGQEIKSLNENLYDMFSVEELEERLQMSVVGRWICGTNEKKCSPIDSGCGTNKVCSPVLGSKRV